MYGDVAYPIQSHVDREFRVANLTDVQKLHNRQLSKIRAAVEWQFGKVIALFPFVDFKQNGKIPLQPIGKYYLMASPLTNVHTCCYGCVTLK